MKEGWFSEALDDACIVEYGTRVVRKENGGSVYPVYGGGGETFRMDTFNRENRVVVSRFGVSNQCVRYVPGKFFLNDSGLTVSTRDGHRLSQRFLDYQLFALNDPIYKLCRGTAQKNLDVDSFRQLTLSAPKALSEQQRLVAILDEAFEGLSIATANAEKNVQNARELFESYRESIFDTRGEGWKECTLDQLVEIKHGFAFKSEYFAFDGGYVLLTPGNFFEEGGYRDRGDKQRYYVGEIPDGFILKKGDFLIAMTEQAAGLLGSSIVVPKDNKFLHNQRLGLVQLKPGTQWSNEFFFHVFNTRHFRQAAHDSASGLKVRHTSPSKLCEITISFPESHENQDQIAKHLDRVRDGTQRLVEMYQSKLSQISALKQSILQRALKGDLTLPSGDLKEAAE